MIELKNKYFGKTDWFSISYKVGFVNPEEMVTSWEHSKTHEVEDIFTYFEDMEPIDLQRGFGFETGLPVSFHDGNHRINTLKKAGLPIPVFIDEEVEQWLIIHDKLHLISFELPKI